MIRMKHLAMIAILSALFAPAAAAATSASDALRVLEKSDQNADGKVTRAEHMALRKNIFVRLDSNRDGRIDKLDTPNPMYPGRDRFFKLKAFLDSNGDGVVLKSEAFNGRSLVFDRADRNRDGIVDKREFAALRSSAVQRGVS